MTRPSFLLSFTSNTFGRTATATAVFLTCALGASACGADFDVSFSSGEDGEGSVETRAIEVGTFDKIDVGSFITLEVLVDPSADASLRFSTNPNLFDNLEADVVDGTLEIKMSDVGDADEARATIVMPALVDFEADGAISATISGIDGDIRVDVSGASDVRASGVADMVTINADGASSVDFSDVKAERANIDASGASSVDVTVSELLTGSASGASDIDKSGDGQVEVSVSGASSVN